MGWFQLKIKWNRDIYICYQVLSNSYKRERLGESAYILYVSTSSDVHLRAWASAWHTHSDESISQIKGTYS